MVKKQLLITDLSRMRGDRVCIFGYDKNLNAIRPVSGSGIRENDLIHQGNLVIKPSSVIEFDFTYRKREIPHTEDYLISDINKPVFVKEISNNKFKNFLKKILDNNIEEMFGTDIYKTQSNKGYTKKNLGSKSIGTIIVDEISSIQINQRLNGTYEYRLQCLDNEIFYNMPINDCAFRKYCDDLLSNGTNITDLSQQISQNLKESEVFLRIGLTRYFQPGNHEGGCWLQVSGLYSFPDYKNNSTV